MAQLGLFPLSDWTACRSCGAAIVWAVTEKGKRMPVDRQPVEDGNLVLVHHGQPGDPPEARVVDAPGAMELMRQLRYRIEHGMEPERPFTLFKSHFATCPNAQAHRRR